MSFVQNFIREFECIGFPSGVNRWPSYLFVTASVIDI